MHAVETPPARLEPELGPRRHRRITGPAGAILFACLFLPAVKGCHDPVYPLEAPMFLPPYLYGLVFACAGAAVTARGLRRVISALRAITLLTIAGSLVLTLVLPPVGIVELVASTLVLVAIDWTGHSERRAAVAASVIGGFCTLWFGMWSSSSDALAGVYLATCGSVALLVGGLVWLVETALVRPASIVVPQAFARRRE